MGFYSVARNKQNQEIAAISFAVWNPNIEHLYVPLGLTNPYGEFSGMKEDTAFSAETVEKALKEVFNRDFYEEANLERLHPLVRMFSSMQPTQTNPHRDKEKVKNFLMLCLDTAKREGSVVINFG